MRRRAVSHNPKRLPRRLRAKHAAISAKSEHKSADQKPKRPSRKYRRRPSNLLKEYSRRSRQVKWLETHLWHAKRFHMTPPGSCDKGGWGYRLPQHPNDKGARAAYRAVAHKCLMFDMSYLGCLEVRDHKTNIGLGCSSTR